jgi:hypothetical protein
MGQAAEVTWHVTTRLSIVVSWCLFWLVHLAAAQLVLFLLWGTGTTVGTVASAFRGTWQSMPVAVLSAAGVSLVTLAAIYWRIAKRLHRHATSRWLLEYLIQDT